VTAKLKSKTERSVCEFQLDDIVLYKHNPESRVESVRDVEDGFREYGHGVPKWNPGQPGELGCDYVLGRGHRRVQAARNLGLKTGWFTINDELTAEQLYLSERPAKRVTSNQKLEWVLSRYANVRSINFGEIPRLTTTERLAWTVAQSYGGAALLHSMVASRLGTLYPQELLKIYEKLEPKDSRTFRQNFKLLLRATYAKKVSMTSIKAYHHAWNTGDMTAKVSLRKAVQEAISDAEDEFGR